MAEVSRLTSDHRSDGRSTVHQMDGWPYVAIQHPNHHRHEHDGHSQTLVDCVTVRTEPLELERTIQMRLLIPSTGFTIPTKLHEIKTANLPEITITKVNG